MNNLRSTLLELASNELFSYKQIIDECRRTLTQHAEQAAGSEKDVKIPVLYCGSYGGFGFSDEFNEYYDACRLSRPELRRSDERLRYLAVLEFGREIMQREPETANSYYMDHLYPALTKAIDSVGRWKTDWDVCFSTAYDRSSRNRKEEVERRGKSKIDYWLRNELPDETVRREWIELLWSNRGVLADGIKELTVGQLRDDTFYDFVTKTTRPIEASILERVTSDCGLSRASSDYCVLRVSMVRKTHGYDISEYDGLERVCEGDPLTK